MMSASTPSIPPTSLEGPALRAALMSHRAGLIRRLEAGEDGIQLGHANARFLNACFRLLFEGATRRSGLPSGIALAAVGSFGRGAVALHSDMLNGTQVPVESLKLPGKLQPDQAPRWAREVYETAIRPGSAPHRVALVAEEPIPGVVGFAVASVVRPEAELETIGVAAGRQRRNDGQYALLARGRRMSGPLVHDLEFISVGRKTRGAKLRR